MSMFSHPKLDEMKCWPLNGWAPGGYAHKACDTCHRKFDGDKRAYRCLECAVNSVRKPVSKTDPKETIVAAAIYHGATISLPPPARHHTILNFMATIMGLDATKVQPVNEGFLTSKGRFVNRTEAYYLAHRHGQIINKSGNADEPTLYSEDLW
jgi:PHP family Zn ribbon phosphoesterase